MGVGNAPRNFVTGKCRSQVVKNDKLLSFEDPQIPVFISGTDSRLEISDEHYKDGLQSLSWTFNPGGCAFYQKGFEVREKRPYRKRYLSFRFHCMGVQ